MTPNCKKACEDIAEIIAQDLTEEEKAELASAVTEMHDAVMNTFTSSGNKLLKVCAGRELSEGDKFYALSILRNVADRAGRPSVG